MLFKVDNGFLAGLRWVWGWLRVRFRVGLGWLRRRAAFCSGFGFRLLYGRFRVGLGWISKLVRRAGFGLASGWLKKLRRAGAKLGLYVGFGSVRVVVGLV